MKRANRGPLIALIFLKAFVAVGFCISLFFSYFEFSEWMLLAVVAGATLFFVLARKNIHKFDFVEGRFLENLNQKEELERQRFPISSSVKSKLIGHDIQLEVIIVSPNSLFIGKQLRNIPFRKEYGVNIVKITRGNKTINVPSADEYLYPYDRVLTIGTQEQVKKFTEVMAADAAELPANEAAVVEVDSFVITEQSYLNQKSLLKAGMRESGCMIIGVERDGDSFMNPSPEFVFKTGDKVWMIGNKSACEWYM